MSVKQGKASAAASIIDHGLSLSSLRETASWIRDELEPLVARDGPHALDPNDVLTLHTLFLDLQDEPVSLHLLRYSRIYLAIREICGKATRWPGRLVDEADGLVEAWEETFGPLKHIRSPLYEKGGRLHGICEPVDLDREDLIRRFAGHNPKQIDNQRAYLHGALGFKPGEWWIGGLFAFRDGIIDDKCTDGGIVYTKQGAYALVLRGDVETDAAKPSRFTYRCHSEDPGRFRLITGDFRSRYPVRILRDHRLASIWAPRTGIRYDGLFKITGWTIKPCAPEKNSGHAVRIEVHFESAEPSIDWESITSIPTAEQTDDYKMYKIIHREQREYRRRDARDIFDHVMPSSGSEDSLMANAPTRSMSICEVAGFEKPVFDMQDSTSTSGSDQFEDGKTHMDGSSDKTFSPLLMSKARRPSNTFDLSSAQLEGSPFASSKGNFVRSPGGVAAVEPFASLRKMVGMSRSAIHRSSYDGSDDARTFTLVDTRFRPVVWDPAPRLNLAPAFNVSEHELFEIAPFSDLRKRTWSNETAFVSPKTSIGDIRGMTQRPKRRNRSSKSEIVFQHAVDDSITLQNAEVTIQRD